MTSTGTVIDATAYPAVGGLLRSWRAQRRLSQLELSHRAEVSARHLSCLETGRSRPTAEMILRLAEHLDVPLGDRNQLLLAGGFAPRYSARTIDDDTLAPVMAGLRRLLDAHLPYPALLLDERWDVVDTNAAVDVLLAGCQPALLEPPVNAVRLSVHPGGLAPRIRNLATWAGHLRRQVLHRAERSRDPALLDLAAEISTFVDLTDRPSPSPGPVLALELESDRGPLSFFSVAARLETATDSTLEGLHLETFLPADAATTAVLTSSSGPSPDYPTKTSP
ncbi:transcriptional regulator with XRE-family HTH domain [Tamaricihabitans halophyticus]|uniref:Transcriptional regulator with XRE-family HTH domain n=1 Tax=Tamaricihabitans halophyticus TaxID=1262583 RepID=A0A4R2QNA6_9PSEU|nr:helix-turn-helix transcriptional regulator [Tamaricihabitans halophyticus]TCP50937.1 transcriptional regulator with XRE-family HTH domain [Tamaricihabitans halophyticus]